MAADGIDDLDVLRRGATTQVFSGIKAPSTIGTHLRAYTFGHVRQLGAVARCLLLDLHRCTGLLSALVAAGALTCVDVDDTVGEARVRPAGGGVWVFQGQGLECPGHDLVHARGWPR